VDQETVLNVLETAGAHCARLLDEKLRNVRAEQVQVDELWAFVFCKQAIAEPDSDHGDQYTFLGIERDSKLIINFLIGKRTKENTEAFLRDLKSRLANRIQLSSDGFDAYCGRKYDVGGVARVFGEDVDYGTEIKWYGYDVDSERRYSAPPCIGVSRKARIGNPDHDKICTSHAERTNLSVRLFNRRFTRLTLGYSKTLRNHKHATALFIAHFNFCRVHSAHDQTPAQAAGIADHPWTLPELLGIAEPINT
jgi:IS1 family transposase